MANKCDGDWWRQTIEGVQLLLVLALLKALALLLSALLLPAVETTATASGDDEEIRRSSARHSIWIRSPHHGGSIEC